MIRAYHVIFGAYGFWLPNDPRGSWSDFVASWELFRFGGPATKISTTDSLAAVPHDHALRVHTKKKMRYPPVVFNGLQARAIANGFAKQAKISGYTVYACSIMPEHAHMVVARHTYSIEQVVRLFKRGGSEALTAAGLHPMVRWPNHDGSLPTPWARKCWKVFLENGNDVEGAVAYVEANPLKEGKRAQKWAFVERYKPKQPSEGCVPRVNDFTF